MKRCGIRHSLGGQTCIRKSGHYGRCRSRAERGPGGTVTYSEWISRGGVFLSHCGYYTIYTRNGE
jgi:hypothetical protein